MHARAGVGDMSGRHLGRFHGFAHRRRQLQEIAIGVGDEVKPHHVSGASKNPGEVLGCPGLAEPQTETR